MNQLIILLVVASIALSGCSGALDLDGREASARARALSEVERARADMARAQADEAIAQVQAQANITIARTIAESSKTPLWPFALGFVVIGALALGVLWMQSEQQRATLMLLSDMNQQSQRTTQTALALMPGWTPQLLEQLNRHAAAQGARVVVDRRGYLVELPTGQRVRAMLEG